MKAPRFFILLAAAGCIAVPARLQAQPVPTPAVAANAHAGPQMTFLTNEYRFGKVNMGQQVNHTFIVSNSGDETLVISNVAPGCHCTTARPWTRQVPPGQTGEIPIKFDSGGIHGDVTRTITVTSNGKLAPVQTLFIRGSVWREIEVNPQTAYMTVAPDATNASATVHIVNQAETPVTLSDPTSANKMFKADLKTLVPGKEFELTVTAQPPLPAGNNVGTISIKTTSTNIPVLTVTALAMMQPSVGISPMQVFLPPEVMGPMTNVITITANGNKHLVLSDVAVCCDQIIKTDLKEVIPGRVYHLAVSFPAGYKILPGQHYQVSVKSNASDHPAIVIPITQFPRQPAMIQRPRVIGQIPPGLPPAPGTLQATTHP